MVSTVTVNNVYRDYVTNGVPGSGNHEPDKADIRALLSRLETIAGIGAVAVATKAELDAITTKDDATPGFVLGDSTATNNGQYTWDDSGSAWVKLRALPDTAAVLQSVSGTNTITASVGTGVDPAVVSLFILVAAATNTGAVTLNISGSGAQDLVDRNGDALVAGSLVSGRAYLVFDDGSDYRLLNDDDRILPFQGAYAGSTTYELGELAENGGSIWYSLQDSNTGNTPTEGAYWTQFLPGASVADGAITVAKMNSVALNIIEGFATVADLLADTNLTYTASQDGSVAAGDIIKAQGFRYAVAASGASDHHVTTAGGVKLYCRANQSGFVHVLAFGATGDGVADDTAEIAKAISTGFNIDFGGPEYSYDVSAATTLENNQTLRGFGATITQIAANTEIFSCVARSNITITGIKFVGKGNDHIDSDSARSVALFGDTSGSNISVSECTFTNFCYSAAKFKAQSDIRFFNNVVVGPGAGVITSSSIGRIYGVLFDSGCTGFQVYGNSISETAQGVRIESSQDFQCFGNKIFDVRGQHGFYIGSNTHDFTITGNTIFNTNLAGIKVQASDAAAVHNTNFSITGNSVNTCGDQGIMVVSANYPGATYGNQNVVISGNSVVAAAGAGIRTDTSDGILIVGNTIKDCGQNGIAFAEDTNIDIKNNLITETDLTAIRDIAASTYITIQNNTIRNCATSSASGDEYGIYVLNAGADYIIDGNIITDTNANMEHAIYIAASINSTLILSNNYCPDAVTTGLRLASTAALKKYANNVFKNYTVAHVPPSIASAATISIPEGHDTFLVTGTATITAVNAGGQAGRIVTLIFQSTATLNRSSSCLIPANFVATADDTVTIACDGNKWVGVASSVN